MFRSQKSSRTKRTAANTHTQHMFPLIPHMSPRSRLKMILALPFWTKADPEPAQSTTGLQSALIPGSSPVRRSLPLPNHCLPRLLPHNPSLPSISHISLLHLCLQSTRETRTNSWKQSRHLSIHTQPSNSLGKSYTKMVSNTLCEIEGDLGKGKIGCVKWKNWVMYILGQSSH